MGRSHDIARGASTMYQTQAASDTRYVNVTGDSMTGNLEVDGIIEIDKTGDHPALRFVEDGSNTRAYMGSGDWAINGLANDDFGISSSSTGDLVLGTGAGSERLRIDNPGRVAMPYQPMFDAYLTSNVTHGSGNYNMSTGDAWSTRTNVGSHFSSGTFTAPIAGKYLFCAGINAGHPVGAMTYFSCEFQVNGARRYIHWFGKGGSSSSYSAANNTAIISLAANDYVRLHTEKSHGVTVIGGAAYTHWCGMLIG